MLIKSFLEPKIMLAYLLFLLVSVYIGKNIIYKNISQSEPLGYYLALPELSVHKGDLVLTCITNNAYKHVFNELGMKDVAGQCNNHLPYILKRVAGVAEDKIEITANGIKINGEYQKNSKQVYAGRGIRLYPLPLSYRHILTADEYFMLGESPHSVDSRYFGIVDKKDIYRRAILIFKTQ